MEVRQFPNLRSITLDLNLMGYDIPVVAMASVVGTVKEFRLQGVGLRVFSHAGEEGRIAANNLEMIGGLLWKLHSFVIEGCDLSDRISVAVGAIPASSASTLQELKLRSVKFGRETFIHGVRFSQLKSIGLKISGFGESDGMPLAEFLRLHPQLEAIEINCEQFGWNARFAPSVLEAIRITCSSELHTLRLRGFVWLKSFPDFESWAFLQDLTRLKNFTIWKMYLANANSVGAKILNCLPSGTQFLKLDYVKFNVVTQSETIAALTGFPNLVHLNLNARGGIVYGPINDAILQTICRSLIKLRVLQFGWTEITDFGLTGERGNYNSGISVRNLKGLHYLDLSLCGEINEEGILKAIQFQELRNLKLNCTGLSKSAVVEIASHNPSLEDVTFASIYEIESDDTPFDEYFRGLFSSIMVVNPRLTLICMYDSRMPKEEDMLNDVICQPSYRVSANLTNTTTLSLVRNTMKIDKSTKGETSAYEYNYTYHYNMPN